MILLNGLPCLSEYQALALTMILYWSIYRYVYIMFDYGGTLQR